MTRYTPWLIAAALALLLGSAYRLDYPSIYQSELDQSQALIDAQKQAAAELRRDLAAARICRETHGEASFAWTHDGELVCIPRRGPTSINSIAASRG